MNTEQERNYLITIPKRGIRIIPPEETIRKMAAARKGEKVGKWSEEEKVRLNLIINSSIIKKRYPTPQDGKEFMKWVDYERREILYGYAKELSDHIVSKWSEISNKGIAIILYGSTTRGLVKNASHPDPSNLDLSVIGEICDEEKLRLFDQIRPKRCELQKQILKDCRNIDKKFEGECGNAGVHIMNIDKLKKNNYCVTLEYIKAKAVALHDPENIWKDLESEAINYQLTIARKKQVSKR